ncbi:MAG: glutaredoxin family protein [bacterium]|nr:glutaredoxin family protein [bacterium]
MEKVIVYSTPTCPYCHMAKEFLNKHKIPFEDVNIAKDQKAVQEMISKSGQIGVPVIDIGGKIVVGFDQKKISQLLGLKPE